MLPLISVVVANWNGRVYLERCFAALAAQTYPAVEIILVDNGSTDGSVAWIAECFPAVRVICNQRNLGFAAANNQGIQAGRGRYVALLNNDAWPEPAWLIELAHALENNPQVGMAASQIVFANQPKVINSTGICVDRCGISWDRRSGEAVDIQQRVPVEVFGACAGAALYRRELFDDVGLFDEDFFAYLEDVDLAWRARWRGWKTIYVPTARVFHLHSATGQEGSAFKTYLLARNKVIVLAKNYPSPHWLALLPLIAMYEALSLIYATWRQRDLSGLRGRLDGLRSLPRALHKRHALLAKPHSTAGEIYNSLEPIPWPWQVYRRYRPFLQA